MSPLPFSTGLILQNVVPIKLNNFFKKIKVFVHYYKSWSAISLPFVLPYFYYTFKCTYYTVYFPASLDTFARTCSPFAMPHTCSDGLERATGKPVRLCYKTCARDGCNESSSQHRLLDLLRRRRKWSTSLGSISRRQLVIHMTSLYNCQRDVIQSRILLHCITVHVTSFSHARDVTISLWTWRHLVMHMTSLYHCTRDVI